MAQRFGVSLWEQLNVERLSSGSATFDYYHFEFGLSVKEPAGLKEIVATVLFENSSEWCTSIRYFPESQFREISILSAEVGIDANLKFQTLSTIATAGSAPLPIPGAVALKLSTGPFTVKLQKALVHGSGLNSSKVRWKITNKGAFNSGEMQFHVILRVSDKRRKKLNISMFVEAKGSKFSFHGQRKETPSRVYKLRLDKIP